MIYDYDRGATDPHWVCHPVSQYEDIAKAGYWLWKTFKWLGFIA